MCTCLCPPASRPSTAPPAVSATTTRPQQQPLPEARPTAQTPSWSCVHCPHRPHCPHHPHRSNRPHQSKRSRCQFGDHL
eukprot:365895-Chlamydomonas_euryale.AAC.6